MYTPPGDRQMAQLLTSWPNREQTPALLQWEKEQWMSTVYLENLVSPFISFIPRLLNLGVCLETFYATSTKETEAP